MKKTFSRWIQTLTTATTSKTSSNKGPSKAGKKASGPQTKKLALELLEDRCLLTASSITLNPLQEFTYQSSGATSISLGLERTHFIESAKISTNGNDIVSVDSDLRTVSVFLNKKNSLYNDPVKTVIPSTQPGWNNAAKFALADMNGDNIADLLVFYPRQVTSGGSTRTDLFVDVYQGLSGANLGKFSTSPVTTQITNPFGYTGTENYFRIENLQVRDVTSDGRPDLLITLLGVSYSGSTSTETTKSFFYTGQNNGFTTTALTVPTGSSGVTGNAIGFGNFTSTTATTPHLLCQTETVSSESGKSTQTLSFYNSTVTSVITTTAAGKWDFPPATPLLTKIADVNSSPGDEIITGIHYINNSGVSTYAVRVSSITALSSGTANIQMSNATVDVDIEPRYCAIGNFNNDSYPDILISDGTSYQFLIGSSTGQFTAQSKVDSFANYLAVATGDFDGDGYQDVVAIGEKHVMFLPGNPSNPNYGTGRVLLSFTAKATSAVFGDFNGDGYLDFVVAQGDAGTTLTLYTGLAPGDSRLFSKFTAISEARSLSVLVAGNFITRKVAGVQYPKTDLAVLHASGMEILVLSFSGSQIVSKNTVLPAAVAHIAAGDFDNDGYDDIAAVSSDNGIVTVLKNKKDGTFDLNGTTVTVGSSTSRSCFVAVADINGDGRLDFAVLNAGDNDNKGAVLFFTQTAAGAFVSNAATVRLDNLNLKQAVRNYQMIFEDFDLDGRIDLLVGVTGTNQAMIFQNKGAQAGQFSSDRNWVGTNLVLDGSLNNRAVFAISTGLKIGHKNSEGYAAKTPGVVLVSGNKIYRFENTTPSEMSPGSMEIVFREWRGTPLTLNNGQYSTIPAGSATTNDPRLTWLHEWGYYYVEVWGSSGSMSEGISSFDCTISYNTSLFSAVTTDIKSTDNFTLNASKTKVDANAGKIFVSGTSSLGLGKINQYVLLFRVFVSPAVSTAQGSIENVGIRISNTGYATPVSSGFLFDSGTPQINAKNLVNLKDGQMMPVYPVIYDLNDDGVINASDFSAFANPVQSWGKTVEGPNSVIAKWDFNHNGTVDVQDFTNFARAWLKKRGDVFLHSLFPGNFPTAWPQLTSVDVPSPAPVAASAPVEVVAAQENEFSESLARNGEVVTPLAGLLVSVDNVYSCTTADIITAESEQVDVKSFDFAPSAAPGFEFAAASLSVSELDTLGYVARTESIFNHERKRIETLDQIFGELFQDEYDALTLEEVSQFTDHPFGSLRLSDQILTELVL